MSIAWERSNSGDHSIERSGFGNGMTCISIYTTPEFDDEERRLPLKEREEEEEEDRSSSTSSSSSIGRNSDEASGQRSSSDGDGGGIDGEEVQSSYKGGALENLDALEEVLPMKRSISMFYAGKSKSFTSLADAVSCSSINDIVKPENAYTRKRKNLLACNHYWDKNRHNILRIESGGVSKRPTSSRSTISLATMAQCSDGNNNSESSNSNSSSPGYCLPPLPPQTRRVHAGSSSFPPEEKFSGWRSFSLSDLQGAAAATTTPNIAGLLTNKLEK